MHSGVGGYHRNMDKFFNTAGPNKPDIHYTLLPKDRVNWPERVRFKVMWRPEEIKVLPQTRPGALNPARRLGYVHAVLG